MTKTLLCLGYSGNEIETHYWQQLKGIFETTFLVESISELSQKQLSAVDFLIHKLGAKADQKLIDQLPNLKYIGMLGTGFGGIDINYAISKKIVVTNIADYATQSVAEFTFATLLENLKSISKAKRQAEKGDYSDEIAGGGN